MQGIGLPMSEITCRHPSPTRLSRQHEQESVPNLTSTAPLLGDTRHLSLWSSDPTLAVDTEKITHERRDMVSQGWGVVLVTLGVPMVHMFTHIHEPTRPIGKGS